jgi:hypothetical protein
MGCVRPVLSIVVVGVIATGGCQTGSHAVFRSAACPAGQSAHGVYDPATQNPPGQPTAERALHVFLEGNPQLKLPSTGYTSDPARNGRTTTLVHSAGGVVDAAVYATRGTNGWWVAAYDKCAKPIE